MQKVIPPSISYNTSDKITWQVWLDNYDRQVDKSQTRSPADTGIKIETGIIKQVSDKEQLTIEATLGFQESVSAIYKIFARNLTYKLEANNSILRMESWHTPFGKSMPIIQGDFQTIKTPKKLNTENWIFVYRIN